MTIRILVSGGSGFLGSAILKKLDRANVVVLALSRKNKYLDHSKNISFLNIDIKDINSCKKDITNFNPDVCVHLAWDNIPNFSLHNCYENLISSINFLSFIINETNCEKIITSGSCFEYGKTLGVCYENDSLKINDYFTWAKNSLRMWLNIETQKHNIQNIWFRVFYAYGNNQRQGSLLPLIFNKISSNQIPEIRSPFNCNDFIHIDDVANAFSISSTSKLKSGIYNISSGTTTSVIDIIRLVEKYLHGSNKLALSIEKKYNRQDFKIVNFWGNNKKLHKEINWLPNISIEQGIKKFIEKT